MRHRSLIRSTLVALSIASGCSEGEIEGIDESENPAFTPAAAPEAGLQGGLADAELGPLDAEPSTRALEFSPYFYTWAWDSPGYAVSSLVGMMEKTGIKAATLGFVVSEKGACDASREIQAHLDDVGAFVASGGHVKVSFGGFDELYLEEACADATSLASAIGAFLDETGFTDLDFDIEKSDAMTEEINARRNAALVALQAKRKLRVSFTLASYPRSKIGEPGGVRPASFAVLRSAVAAGVVVTHVNLLTMDFGAAYSSGRLMGPLAISALTDAADQLKGLYPGLDEAGAFRMLGATPMIGQNDKPTEIFTVDDVATLVDFTRARGLGLLSFWAIQRDSDTCTLSGLYSCSQAQSEPFEFSKAFVSRL